jgi:glycosyltransferase involved in cell wall biosynthesis
MSRIIPLKGLDVLLRAFFALRSKRDDVFLLIGGDGPFRPYCQELARSLGIPDVQFLGSVHPDFAADLYKQSDVFVLTSYYWENRYEPWGLVINEAASMSLPIITTTAVGAAQDLVIEGYNGFVVKDNNVDHLHITMEKILDLDLVTMGNNSRFLFKKKNDFINMANGFTSAIEHAKSK